MSEIGIASPPQQKTSTAPQSRERLVLGRSDLHHLHRTLGLHRWAGLLLVSDLCIETMAPNMPADPTKPVGKFYTKFGRHLHSVGYKVDDLVGLGNHLIEQGLR